ncbi:hypothetical protein SNEBB_006759 [Seison nebaliae]|nr:hypothetical protein SNEBB_006759 [Seison nebaliae]
MNNILIRNFLITIVVVILKIGGEKICDNVKYVRTPCSHGNRWIVRVPSSSRCQLEECERAKLVNCPTVCPSGQYYQIEENHCDECPTGTFSRGNSILYSNEFNETDFVVTKIDLLRTKKNKKHFFSPRSLENCDTVDNWKTTESYLEGRAKHCAVILTYSTYISGENGQVTFRYRSDGNLLFLFSNDRNSPIIYMQQKMSHVQLEKTDGNWRQFRTRLKSGYNELVWVIIPNDMFNQDDLFNEFNEASIDEIEVIGLDFAEQCSKCLSGTFADKSGASFCDVCGINEYSSSDSTTCENCLSSEYSRIASSKCEKKSRCIHLDYKRSFTCTSYNTFEYEWIKPMVCDPSLHNSIHLPNGVKNCSINCNPGYELNESMKLCTRCPSGYFSRDGKKCSLCPRNYQTISSINLLHWDDDWMNEEKFHFLLNSNISEEVDGWTKTRNFIRTNYQSMLYCLRRDSFCVYIFQFDVPAAIFTNVETDMSNLGRKRFVEFEFETICPISTTKSLCVMKLYSYIKSHSLKSAQYTVNGDSDGRRIANLTIDRNEPLQLIWMFRPRQIDDIDDHLFHDTFILYSINVTNVQMAPSTDCVLCDGRFRNDDNDGGACMKCKESQFFSISKRRCMNCPKNWKIKKVFDRFQFHSSDIRSKKLLNISLVDDYRRHCEKCPKNMISSNGIDCISDCRLRDKDRRLVDFSAIEQFTIRTTSSDFMKNNYQMWNISLCGTNNIECHDNSSSMQMLGPILKNFNDGFMQENFRESIDGRICRMSFIGKSDNEIESKNPILLSKDIISLNYSTDQLDRRIVIIEYESITTAKCEKFRSFAKLYCRIDMDEDITLDSNERRLIRNSCGEKNEDKCCEQIIYYTKYACPICLDEELIVSKSDCVDGRQRVEYKSINNICRIDEKRNNEMMECSPLSRMTLFIVMLTLFLLVSLACIIIYCWRKNLDLQYKYTKVVSRQNLSNNFRNRSTPFIKSRNNNNNHNDDQEINDDQLDENNNNNNNDDEDDDGTNNENEDDFPQFPMAESCGIETDEDEEEMEGDGTNYFNNFSNDNVMEESSILKSAEKKPKMTNLIEKIKNPEVSFSSGGTNLVSNMMKLIKPINIMRKNDGDSSAQMKLDLLKNEHHDVFDD